MIKKLRKIEQVILKLEQSFIAALLFILVTFQILQVLFRYVLSSPLGWVDEASRFIFIWMIMIGSAVAVQKLEHFNVDFIVNKFPNSFFKIFNSVINILSLVFIITVAYIGFNYLLDTRGQLSSGMGIPVAVLNFAIPIGFALMCIHTILNFFLKNKKEDIPTE